MLTFTQRVSIVMDTTSPFWHRIALTDMTPEQWESVCDGCGLCCLHKLENEEDNEIYYTDVACRLLDTQHCRCTQYPERTRHVPGCLVLTPATLANRLRWLPATCAYKRLAQHQPLPSWHPLISGNVDSVHQAGISVRGRCVNEHEIALADLEERVVYWVDGFGE